MNYKEKFLEEHNKLSPVYLQADLVLLDKFKEAKISLFKDDTWPIDKLRRPFIIWLTALPKGKAKKSAKDKNRQNFNIYPREEA